MAHPLRLSQTIRSILILLAGGFCLLGVADADEPHADLSEAVRLSTDAYTLNGRLLSAPYDRDALFRLRESSSEPAREIAELRLGIEELRSALREKREDAKQAIVGGTAVAVPLVSASLIKNAISQLADGDDSLERQFDDGLGIVQDLRSPTVCT